MKKTIVILAHPNFDKSVANSSILHFLKEETEIKETRNLSALYPDFKIDVELEQAALLAADNVIFQFPFYWYSIPPILKQWIDQVLTYGFAYGTGGDSLKGKNFIVSTTTGTPAEYYQKTGANRFTMEEFLNPIEQTATLIQMNYLPPVYSNAMMVNDSANSEAIRLKAKNHAGRLTQLIG